MHQILRWALVGGLSVAIATPALAQTFNSGSTGADGAFNPSCTPPPCTVTVTLPPTGVFNLTTINVPANITVKFTKNADNTPVTMLASGNVIFEAPKTKSEILSKTIAAKLKTAFGHEIGVLIRSIEDRSGRP